MRQSASHEPVIDCDVRVLLPSFPSHVITVCVLFGSRVHDVLKVYLRVYSLGDAIIKSALVVAAGIANIAVPLWLMSCPFKNEGSSCNVSKQHRLQARLHAGLQAAE